jgi:hypothetical protein
LNKHLKKPQKQLNELKEDTNIWLKLRKYKKRDKWQCKIWREI